MQNVFVHRKVRHYEVSVNGIEFWTYNNKNKLLITRI